MDSTREVIQTEKDCDPAGNKIVCKFNLTPVNKSHDADAFALCTSGPHWVQKHLVRCGVCESCAKMDTEFIETGASKRKLNTSTLYH